MHTPDARHASFNPSSIKFSSTKLIFTPTMAPKFAFPTPSPANPDDIHLDLFPLLRIFKDGKIERFLGTSTVPPGTDPASGVQSKDVIFRSEDGVSLRLYLPKDAQSGKKLPVLVYFHGGGFCVETALSPLYHSYLNSLAAEANIVVVSVNFRLAPEHPLPAAYDDSWTALKWVASHTGSEPLGSDTWIKDYVDFSKVFLSGDSAGGNIVHHMAVRVGEEGLPGVKLDGIILVHPFFNGVELIGNEANSEAAAGALTMFEKIWKLVHPAMADLDDPWINPFKDLEKARKVGCERVMVCVASKDALADRGVEYGEVMKRCGKEGLEVEVFKSEEMQHVFHLFDPDCEEAKKLMKKVVQFINGD